MKTARPLAVAGAWELSPELHGEPGRLFADIIRVDDWRSLAGPLDVAQASLAVSTRNTVRGIHFGPQKKIVTCVAGAVLDVVADLRVGSPTFGRWDSVTLDDVDRRVVVVGEGLGHGYCVLSEQATLAYLLAPAYDPGAEREVHPLDPDLAISWPTDQPELSARDVGAPSLATAARLGLLPNGDSQ